LLDTTDDAAAGPGVAPIPDVGGAVTLVNNLPGCNSVDEILASAPQEPPLAIPTVSNYGLALLALLMLGVGVVGRRRFA